MNNTFIRALIAIAFLGAFQADADASQISVNFSTHSLIHNP